MSGHALLTSPIAGRAQLPSARPGKAVAAAGQSRAPAQQASLPQMFSASQSLPSAVPCARASTRLAARRRGAFLTVIHSIWHARGY